MSPRLRSGRLAGYSGQRGAIGLVFAGNLALALVCMLLVVDSGRLYLEKRKLQAIADTAALEAISRKGDCLAVGSNTATEFATANASRNGFSVPQGNSLEVRCGVLSTGANNLRVFSENPAQVEAIQVTASRPVLTSIAGGVWSLFNGTSISTTTQLTTKAVAASKVLPPQAQLTIKTTLIEVDSTESDVLNLVFGKLLGGNLNLDVAGWQGLVDTDINLLSYLDQLALAVGVQAGSYNELLNKTVKLDKLIETAITVLQNGGSTATVAVDGLAKINALVSDLDVTLGSILQLQTGAVSAGLNTNLNVFQLAEAFIQLANKNNAVMAEIPVNIPGLLNAGVKLKVIEPPQLSAIGDPTFAKDKEQASRIYVRTAQLRLGLTLSLPVLGSPVVDAALNGLVAPLTDTLNNLLSLNLAGTVTSLLCALGGYCERTDLKLLSSSTTPSVPSIDVILELSRAESYVTGYTCLSEATKTLTTQTNASVVTVKIGRSPDLYNSFGSSPPLDPIPPLPVVDIGAITCFKPLLGLGPTTCDAGSRKPFYGGGLGLSIKSDVGGTTSSLGPYTYNQPPEIKQPPLFHDFPTTSLVDSLRETLQGVELQVYKPTGFNLLGGLLHTTGTLLNGINGTLGEVIGNVLSPLLDPIVDGLLNTLGINLNLVEVGANLSCKPRGTAVLVI